MEEDSFERFGIDPYAVPEGQRDPVRRVRGRLPAPVSVWTAWGRGKRAVGLAVSSVMVIEGEPGAVVGVIGPLTDLWEAIESSGHFVMHVLSADQSRLADQMAGRYPDDPFRMQSIIESEHGPMLAAAPTRCACTLTEGRELGWFLLVSGRIDSSEIGPVAAPLVNYRGRYLSTGPRPGSSSAP